MPEQLSAEHRELARTVADEAGVEFFEVFCDTPLDDCERRDPKGLYAKARSGEITHFTGIEIVSGGWNSRIAVRAHDE